MSLVLSWPPSAAVGFLRRSLRLIPTAHERFELRRRRRRELVVAHFYMLEPRARHFGHGCSFDDCQLHRAAPLAPHADTLVGDTLRVFLRAVGHRTPRC